MRLLNLILTPAQGLSRAPAMLAQWLASPIQAAHRVVRFHRLIPAPVVKHGRNRPGLSNIRLWTIGALAVLCAATTAKAASPITIGFDDIQPTSTSYGIVPDGYNGLDWDNFDYIFKDYLPGSGYQAAATSGNFSAFDIFGGSSSVSSSTLFGFNSIELTSAWIPGLKVTIEGLVNNVVVATSGPITLSNTAPLLYTPSGFPQVDELRFSASFSSGDDSQNPAGTQFAIDDLNITPTDIVPVPEPRSLALLAAGLCTAVCFYRRGAARSAV